MNCWKCGRLLPEKDKIGFRSICPSCGIDLHTCTNCRYFAPGKPNDCIVPGTEFIRDRERANLCEDFKVQSEFPRKKEGEALKDKFNSLFKKDESS